MRLCFDLDNTLCYGYPYENAKPFPGAAEFLQNLHELGHTIIIYTARGMRSRNGNLAHIMVEIAPLTLEQLDSWNFHYDSIVFGKPDADIFIDDKATNVLNYSQILSMVGRFNLSRENSDG